MKYNWLSLKMVMWGTFKKIRTVLIVSLTILLLSGFAQAAARIPVSAPESRYVWSSDAGMDPTFNLTPMNFDIFYYDIDNNAGSEFLSIDLGNPAERVISANKISYQTSAFNISFKYTPFGNYSAIGFMGEKYLAAYTEESRIATKPMKLLIHRLLSKVLIDEKENHTIIDGRNLSLGDDYILHVKDVNITAGTAIISIEKNGIDFYRRTVKQGDTLIYEKGINRVQTLDGHPIENPKVPSGFLPIIAVHVDSLMAKGEKAAVIINGIFQLSDIYTDTDPQYGSFGITEVSETSIIMKNRIKMGLSVDESENFVNIDGSDISPVYLISNIRLKIAASNILRFHVYDELLNCYECLNYEKHERRGAVYTESNPVLAWDGLNFPGFWYDLDSNSFSEKLEINNISGRKIPKGDLVYSLLGIKTPLAISRIKGTDMYGTNVSYLVFGIGTNKYIAVNGKSGVLSKVLLEHTNNRFEKRTFVQDEIWELGEGYNLTVKSIDVRDEPRKALLSLSKNGEVLKEEWVPRGGIFSYYDINLTSTKDMPKFATYLDSVFAGSTTDLIQLRYTWLISSNIIEIHQEDRLDVFNITSLGPDHIELKNNRAINLISGSRINLIGNLGFVVSNSADMRFYPSNMIPMDMSTEATSDAPDPTLTEVDHSGSPRGTKIPGYEFVMALTAFSAIYIFKAMFINKNRNR